MVHPVYQINNIYILNIDSRTKYVLHPLRWTTYDDSIRRLLTLRHRIT